MAIESSYEFARDPRLPSVDKIRRGLTGIGATMVDCDRVGNGIGRQDGEALVEDRVRDAGAALRLARICNGGSNGLGECIVFGAVGVVGGGGGFQLVRLRRSK